MKKTALTLIILLFMCSISTAQTKASKTSSKKNHKRTYVAKKKPTLTEKTVIQDTQPVKTYNKLTDGYWNYRIEEADNFESSTGTIITYNINVTIDGEYYNNYKYWLYTDDETGNKFVQLSFYGSSRYLTTNPREFLEEKLKSYLENHYNARNFNF